MQRKKETSYFVKPVNADEMDKAWNVFQYSKENNLPRTQYIDSTGTIWRWDNKGKGGNKKSHGGHTLIRTAGKLARNSNRRALKLNQSFTEADFEKAWPGRGADLFKAEQDRIKEIYASAKGDQDIDHIWSLKSGGFQISNNLRPLDAKQNRSEGDRGVPDADMQTALMLAHTKADQARLQGPRLPAALQQLAVLQERLRNPQSYLNGAMDAVSFVTNNTPMGKATDIAVDTFNTLVDQPVRAATGNGIYEHIPNGSQEERRDKNKKVNGQLSKNNGHNGNGAAHSLGNELLYSLQKIARGELPYTGD